MGKFVLVVVVAALLIYLTVRLIERRGIRPSPKPTPPRPVGPDDDPDFLWGLDKKKRHRKPPPPPPETDSPDSPDSADETEDPEDPEEPGSAAKPA